MKSKKRNRLTADKEKKMLIINHFIEIENINVELLLSLFQKELIKIKNVRKHQRRENPNL